MKKILYLIRHAQAEEAGNSRMLRDFDRDLTSRGVMQSARMGKYMHDNDMIADILVSSSANRTMQTAKIIAEQLKIDPDNIVQDENLYGNGPRGYLSCLNNLKERTNSLAIVGHNPDISFFAEYLVRDDIQGSMKKATLIIMEFDNLNWSEISAKSGSLLTRVDVENLNFS